LGAVAVRVGFAEHSPLRGVVEDVIRSFVEHPRAKAKVFKGLWQEFAHKQDPVDTADRIIDVSALKPVANILDVALGKGN
jgi:hypothetical protein